MKTVLEVDGLPAAVLLALLGTAGIFYVNIMPALVAGLQSGLGLSARAAGLIGACNVYGAALGALIAALLSIRLPWRRTARAALLAMIVVDSASALIHDAGPLMIVRFLQGSLGGFLIGVTVAVIARTRAPDRGFGVFLFVQFTLGGAGIIVLPRLVSQAGTSVLFLVLVALSAVALLILPLIPAYPLRAPQVRQANGQQRSGSAAALLCALLGLFLFQAFMMSTSAYTIGMGYWFQLPAHYVSTTLGVGTWVGLLGAGAVVVIGLRFGRFVPIVAGTFAAVMCNVALVFDGTVPWVWMSANAGGSIAWAFVLPYLYGLSSAFDQSGRTAPWAGFASKLGLATGPALGAFLLEETRFIRLLWWACAVGLLAALAAAIPARNLDSEARA